MALYSKALTWSVRKRLRWNSDLLNTMGTLRQPVAILETNILTPSNSLYRGNRHLTPIHKSCQFHATTLDYLYRVSIPGFSIRRNYSSFGHDRWAQSNKQTATYVIAIAITVVGLSYAAVPLYRLYCQASGYGGTVTKVDAGEKIEKMAPVEERELTIRFNADRSAGMRWNFRPQQREIKLVPGETALAFYTARNPTDNPITGISTYNVIPFDAGQYFNKIQCFCFEEQRLNPHEEVDMPVFFYIDPEFAEDPSMAKVDTITLSYTFFEAKDGETIDLPVPNFLKQ